MAANETETTQDAADNADNQWVEDVAAAAAHDDAEWGWFEMVEAQYAREGF